MRFRFFLSTLFIGGLLNSNLFFGSDSIYNDTSLQLDSTVQDSTGGFSLLTINLWGLPVRLPGHAQRKRFRKIPDMLNESDSDIICMQEVFSKKLRKRILKRINMEYHIYSNYNCNQSILWPIVKDCHGGLMTISKYPIIKETFYQYPTYYGMRVEEKIGKKGFLVSTIKKDDRVINVINTHLYAGSTDKDEYHRMNQIYYMDSVLATLNFLDEGALFLMGDLNVVHPVIADRTEQTRSIVFEFLERELGFVEYQTPCEDVLHTMDHSINGYTSKSEMRQKLDYILYRPTPDHITYEEQAQLMFIGEDAISDHVGLSKSVRIADDKVSAPERSIAIAR